MYYRAFYLPPKGSYRETIVDNTNPEELPSGALLVIFRNDQDGTRQIISEKTNLTPKEQHFYDYAQRQLEYKSDGGPSAEHIEFLKENKHLRGKTNG